MNDIKEFNEETRVIDLNVAQLINLIKQTIKRDSDEAKHEKQLVHGMAGIASIFNCSCTTAWRIKKSGVIDEAISQHGRTIVCDANLALQLFHKKQQRQQ